MKVELKDFQSIYVASYIQNENMNKFQNTSSI